jgi:ferric iron reductase protein FhuF
MADMQAQNAKLSSNLESKLNKLFEILNTKLALDYESLDAKLSLVSESLNAKLNSMIANVTSEMTKKMIGRGRNFQLSYKLNYSQFLKKWMQLGKVLIWNRPNVCETSRVRVTESLKVSMPISPRLMPA